MPPLFSSCGWSDRFFWDSKGSLVMAALFGPSEQDLQRLRATVQSLGTASVPGLAAALAWRERKIERLLAHELARAGTPLAYDPGRRTVRWAKSSPTSPTRNPENPTSTARSFAPRTPPAPAPVLTQLGLKTLCPSCHVPLQATGSGSLAVCPQCGRLSSTRIGTTVAPADPKPAPASTAGPGPPPSLPDRRSQELFAAWLTARPIPCPKCRTPLKHRAVSEYVCPACGQTVVFPKTGELGRPTPPAA